MKKNIFLRIFKNKELYREATREEKENTLNYLSWQFALTPVMTRGDVKTAVTWYWGEIISNELFIRVAKYIDLALLALAFSPFISIFWYLRGNTNPATLRDSFLIGLIALGANLIFRLVYASRRERLFEYCMAFVVLIRIYGEQPSKEFFEISRLVAPHLEQTLRIYEPEIEHMLEEYYLKSYGEGYL